MSKPWQSLEFEVTTSLINRNGTKPTVCLLSIDGRGTEFLVLPDEH